MKERTFARTAIAVVLAGSTMAAYALGLGEINVESNLNQRFYAVIPLSEINSEDLESVTVSVAPNEAFDRAGIERSEYLASLKFAVKNDGGNPRVVVTSSQIAREPVVNLLVQARWRGGKIVREYSVLLDPPTPPRLSAAPVPPPAPKPVPPPAAVAPAPVAPPVAVTKPVEPKTEMVLPPPPKPESEFFETGAEARAAARTGSATAKRAPAPRAAASSAVTGETYGPIKPKETLWHAASSLRPNTGVSMEQMMLALVEANPGTIQKGITLTEGSLLKVPSLASILAYSPREATERLAAIQAGKAGATAAKTMPAAGTKPPESAKAPEPAKATAMPAAPQAMPSPPAPVAAPAAAAPTAVAPAPSPAQLPATPATSEPVPAAAPATEPTATPAAAPPAAATTAPTAAQQKPPVAAEPPLEPAQQPGSALTAYWPLLAGAGIAALLAFVGFRRMRKPEEPGAPPSWNGGPPTKLNQRTVSPPSPTRAGDTSVHTARALAEDKAPLTSPAATTRLDDVRAPSAMAGKREGFEPASAQTPAATKTSNDPLADADFHLAYGLHDEAIAVLKAGISRFPARDDLKIKLAETYFAVGKSQEFLAVAEPLKGKVSATDWGKLAIMGSQLLPGAAVFKAADGAKTITDFDLAFDELPASTAKPLGMVAMDTSYTQASTAPELPNLAKDLADEVGAVLPPSQIKAPTAEDPNSIDFMLGQSIVPLGMNTRTTPPKGKDTPLEFKLGDPSLNVDTGVKPKPQEPSSLDNDYEISMQSLQVSLTPREVAPASEDELNTKLDLARAYVEMGDHESARGLLKEVQETGGDQHKKEAEALLQRLPA